MKISVVIPALNEEAGIAAVINQIPIQSLSDCGYQVEVVVVDNGSTDRTSEIAKSHGATVVYQPERGYGNAYKMGFTHATGDTIVTGDADMTYPFDALPHLLETFKSRGLDFLNTDRLSKLNSKAMTKSHVFGNWLLSLVTRILFGWPFRDSQSGMWIFKRSILQDLHLKSGGMPFSQELKIEAFIKKFKCGEIAIEYRERIGKVKLSTIKDGFRNIWHLIEKYLSHHPVKRYVAAVMNIFKKKDKKQIERIAFVCDAVLPYHQGGREKRLFEITKRLVQNNREVHIYTMKWWDGGKTVEHDGVHFHALCKLYPLYHGERRSMKAAILFGFATFKLLFERFDVLDVDQMPFFPLYSARIVTWLKRKKLQATWHEVWGKEYWQEYLSGYAAYFGYLIERFSFLLPDVIVSNSLHTTKRLREVGFKGDIKTIPLGVDLESIYTAPPALETSDVIFVGRLLQHKNADILVRAIALVKNTHETIRCVIVGDGPEKNKLIELIEKLELNENIRILDKVEGHSNLYGLMKASKMLVLPSVREGFGLVAIEAHAAGIPVITSSHKNNAAKELIQEGVNGFVVEASAEAIADRINYILNIRNTLEPKRDIEQYDWQPVIKRLEQGFGLTS